MKEVELTSLKLRYDYILFSPYFFFFFLHYYNPKNPHVLSQPGHCDLLGYLTPILYLHKGSSRIVLLSSGFDTLTVGTELDCCVAMM